MGEQQRPARRGEVQRRDPPELKERAIRLVNETAAEQGKRHRAVGKVAHQLGIGPESLRHWVRQAEIDGGLRPSQTTRYLVWASRSHHQAMVLLSRAT